MNGKEQQPTTLGYKDVIAREKAYLVERRKKLNNGEYKEEVDNWFGLALSGGGIRSAIINFGFLRCLNEYGLLKKADYISTVSGGGYTGAYIQSTLKNAKNLQKLNTPDTNVLDVEEEGTKDDEDNSKNPFPYEELYQKDRIEFLKAKGNYMTPGFGLEKKWNQFLLVISYLSSLIMSWIGPLIALVSVYFFTSIIANNFTKKVPIADMEFNNILYQTTLIGIGILVIIHFILNILYAYSLNISLFMDKLKGWFLLLVFANIFFFFCYIMILSFDQQNIGLTKTELMWLGIIVLFCFAGFFANPNATSLHRYYRNRLADAFLHSGGPYKNVPLHKLADLDGEITDYCAPYPLINTCLNLQGGQNDDSFQGAKTGDYFLLSPLFSGSKLTGYLSTRKNKFFKKMTLPTAMSVSAAAVNPGMGLYSSTILSVLTTLLNFRLGFWVISPKRLKIESDLKLFDKIKALNDLNNPTISEQMAGLMKKRDEGDLTLEEEKLLIGYLRNKELLSMKKLNPVIFRIKQMVWWPKYFFYELFSGINTKHRMLNISDGGHIENLAVFELLRRRCKLIIGIDAGADPKNQFSDLHNLVVRARNELGIELKFRKDQIPEEVIKPRPSHGYSRTHFAVADIIQLTEERGKKGKIGTFVYVKSSVTAPGKKKDISLQSKSYQYKTFHADFPHESTADQFFDEAQWEAYYYLGYYIAKDVLMGRNHKKTDSPPKNIDGLYDFYEKYNHSDPVYDDPDVKKNFMSEKEFKHYNETEGEQLSYNIEQKAIQQKMVEIKDEVIEPKGED